jgi:hypothetical protein
MTAAVKSDVTLEARMRAMAPMGRPARRRRWRGEVLYQCSDATSYGTGQVHIADGGFTARGRFPAELIPGVTSMHA